MTPIEQQLRQFVIETFLFGNDDGQFSSDDSFMENGLIDSMGILNLVTFVQTEYGIEVTDAELIPEIWDSVNRIAAFIVAKRAVDLSLADTSCVDESQVALRA